MDTVVRKTAKEFLFAFGPNNIIGDGVAADKNWQTKKCDIVVENIEKIGINDVGNDNHYPLE